MPKASCVWHGPLPKRFSDSLQCDQNPEGCGQCANARRKCPGYRKLEDVIFKDESGKVARKFQSREARSSQKLGFAAKSAASSEESSPDQDDGIEFVLSDTTTLPRLNLAPTIEERAVAFFFNNYVMAPDGGPSVGHMAILHKMTGSLPECLFSGMKAVGLAGYSHSVYAPSLMKHAQYQYVQALRATNEALRSPILVTRDSTLISIHILSIYEAITGTNQKSLKAWADHIFGASALLKLRGREQISTMEGRQLFLQTVSMLMVTSVQQNIPLPDYIMEWTREAREMIPFFSPGLSCQEVMMEFTAYNASICDGTLNDSDAIITRGLELDGMLKDAFENPYDTWEYETVFTEAEPELIYNGCYHVYHDNWVAQIWNGMRCFRCLFHERIHETIQAARLEHPPRLTDPSHTTQLQISTDIMCNMQADILASVPQHLGYVSRLNRYPTPPLFIGPWKPERGPAGTPMRMSGPYFILWPLWYSGVMNVTTDATRRYVARNLKLIGDELGIQQATFLAEVLDKKMRISFR